MKLSPGPSTGPRSETPPIDVSAKHPPTSPDPQPPPGQLGTLELAVACAQLANGRKAESIEVIQVTEQIKVADYFVIASGTSRAHVKALFDELHVRLKALGHVHRPAEGHDLGWWVVLDYGDVVVHLLQPEARSYYDIERLYGDCPRLDWKAQPQVLPDEPLAGLGT